MSSFTNAYLHLQLALDHRQGMFTTQPFAYYEGSLENPDYIYNVPRGTYSDGISGFFKRFGPYATAGFLHDFLYAHAKRLGVSKWKADKIFEEACIVLGCKPWLARIGRIGLTIVGWIGWYKHRWRNYFGTAQAWSTDGKSLLFDEEAGRVITMREANTFKIAKTDRIEKKDDT